MTAAGDDWLTAPGGGDGPPLDAGPVDGAVTAADCAGEIAARRRGGVQFHSGEWHAEEYGAADERHCIAAEIGTALGPLVRRLGEQQDIVNGLKASGLDHLAIEVATLQFMSADNPMHGEPPGEQGSYNRAVEEFVKTNHGALVEHAEGRAAETRAQIRYVMYAARRLRAFDTTSGERAP